MAKSTNRLIPGLESRGLLSRRDVAVRFGVSPQTVTRWANAGLLPFVLTMGGHRRYPHREVERIVGQLWLHGIGLEATTPVQRRLAVREGQERG